MIDFENVCFSYGTEGANVNNLSFHIEKGEFVAITGANGAGKTTTVKLISGLLKANSGKVFINGLDAAKTRVSERAKSVGYLFQNPDRQICQNTVYDEIAFGLKAVKSFASKEETKRRVEEVLNIFGFTGQEEPYSLSRGQRQRVALASVIAVNPQILILDEPTTGLDYRECCHIMDLIKEMNEECATTVVMVCHDMEVVSDYAGRLLVMSGG
ncbi:MAG: ABC transporter ATP-binding protein, partial [Clostridia bacterium]|nr:ABC transporter ATP-binding protein [Clostridia bacterium]